jgi:hypothetical protein
MTADYGNATPLTKEQLQVMSKIQHITSDERNEHIVARTTLLEIIRVCQQKIADVWFSKYDAMSTPRTESKHATVH